MRVLTDTHALVWAVSEPERLSKVALRVFQEGEVVTSVANLWELLLKAGRASALVEEPLKWWTNYVVKTNLASLPIRASHVIALGALPDVHKDPFDRILVAQAITEGIPLVTRDGQLRRYGVITIW